MLLSTAAGALASLAQGLLRAGSEAWQGGRGRTKNEGSLQSWGLLVPKAAG